MIRNQKHIRKILPAGLFFILIVAAIPLLSQPARNVRQYGAAGDGVTDDTRAIQCAVDACREEGGGHVFFPPGDYVSGPIYLTSNLVFEIGEGAILRCTEDVGAFFKSGTELTPAEISEWKGLHTDYQMINGKGLDHVTIKGQGTICGQGEKIWWNLQKVRPYVIRLEDCRQVRFQDLEITQSPFHSFNFTEVTGLDISGITLRNDRRSPNTDGLHIVRCRSVRISNVDFDTGDDCILTPGSEDVLITHSRFRTPWGVWWPSGSCRRITLSNCVVDCQMLIKDFRNAEDVIISNIVATGPGRLFSSYGGPMRNVLISNVIADGWAEGGWFENGENIVLENVHIIRDPEYGSAILKNGLSFRNVKGLTLRNVSVEQVKSGSALYCYNIDDLEIEGFKATNVPDDEPVILLENTRNVYLHGIRGNPGTVLARLSGKQSGEIRYQGNDWNGAILQVSREISPEKVKCVRAEIRSVDLPDHIPADQPFPVIIEIHSEDPLPGVFPVQMSVDDESDYIRWIWLEAGESKIVTSQGPELYREGSHSVVLNNRFENTIRVDPSSPSLQVLSSEVIPQNRILPVNKQGRISLTVKNTGSRPGIFELDLRSNGSLFTRKQIELDPGQEDTLLYKIQGMKPGIHQLEIGDRWKNTLKVYGDALESDYLYYDFEGISDSVVPDRSGLGNDGLILANRGGSPPARGTGAVGNCILFNGESAYGIIPGMCFSFPMTLSVWIKPGSLTPSSTAGRQMILYASEAMGNDGYGPEPEIHLMRGTGKTFVFWSNVQGQKLDLRTSIEEEESWYFVTVVYDTTSRMYINGELVSTQRNLLHPDFSHFSKHIYIGRPNTENLRYFNGAIDELRFFKGALSDDQVRQLYNSSR